MEALIPIVTNALIPGFGTILTALVFWGLFELTRYVKTKTKNEAVNDAVLHVCDTVETTVRELEQTLVPQIKKAAADGKISGEEARELKEVALRKVKDQIPEKIAKTAEMAVNSVDKLIRAKIENAVFELKTGSILSRIRR